MVRSRFYRMIFYWCGKTLSTSLWKKLETIMIKKLIDYQARKLFRNIQKSLVCFLKICFKLYNADLNYPDKTDKTLKLKFVFLKIGYFWKKTWWWQTLLTILAEMKWCNSFCEIQFQHLIPKIFLIDFLSQSEITPKQFVHLLTKLH